MFWLVIVTFCIWSGIGAAMLFYRWVIKTVEDDRWML